MLPFRHIVFPVDYSESCESVIPYVKDMVRQFSAQLTLVHASGLGLEALDYTDLSIADPDWEERSRAFEEKRLREFAGKAFPNQHVESIVDLGDPGTVIHRVVQHQGADLVMLPTHGRGPVRRFLLGSVTAKVLHDVSAAVWTNVNTKLSENQPRIPYKTILCALEDAGEGEAVLRAAAALAECYHARLSLAHVVESPVGTSDLDFGPYKKDLMDVADHWLREMKWELGLDVPHTVIDSDAANGIRQAAIEKKADLIIAGRGFSQNTFSRIWSRLYPIIRESPCPVLSI
jgi:nucleotide-binding universal stress UspA family protein